MNRAVHVIADVDFAVLADVAAVDAVAELVVMSLDVVLQFYHFLIV